MMVNGIDGRRRGTWEEGKEPMTDQSYSTRLWKMSGLKRDGADERVSRDPKGSGARENFRFPVQLTASRY